jgi:cytochrome b subunit of formate dehydrogenase
MVTGYVTADYAKHHHKTWWEELNASKLESEPEPEPQPADKQKIA